MPIGVYKALGGKDRCSPEGAVISAFLSAVVEGDTIVGWLGNSAFSVQELLPNGTLAPLDLTPTRLALQAHDADMEAIKAGIVGVSSLIAERRVQEQKTGNLPSRLREAAFERATVQNPIVPAFITRLLGAARRSFIEPEYREILMNW